MVWQQVLQCHSGLHWNSWQDSGCQEGHKERHEKKRCGCSKILQPSIPTSSRSVHLWFDYPNTVDHNVSQPPTAWPVWQPPPTESSLPIQPQHQPVTAWPQYQLPVSQSSPHMHPYYQHPLIQPLHQYGPTLSPVIHPLQYPKHHQPDTALPTSSDLSQQPALVDLDQQRQPPAPTVTPKESFLKMLYSPNKKQKPAVLEDQSQTSTSEHETSSSSSADTVIIERDPIPEFGEPSFSPPELREDRSWKPCRACKAEVEKIVEEKAKLQDVLCGISKYILSVAINCSFNAITFFSHNFPKVPNCNSVHTSTVKWVIMQIMWTITKCH